MTATPTRSRRAEPGDVSAGRVDVGIMLVATALAVIGLVMNLSASSIASVQNTGSAFTLFARQFLWAAMGMVALFVAARIDYRRFRGWAYVGLPVTWVVLLATLHPAIGTQGGGATRWLTLGPLSFQPSEAAKLVLILFGADILARKLHLMHDWRHVVVPFFGAVGITCLLVLMQPDFGTTAIIAATAFLLAYLAGARLQFLGIVAGTGVVVGIPIMLAEGYRRARLFGFFNADADPLNTGWQSVQSLVGLGSGGLFGMGLGQGGQKWFFLPNAHTDFIFAIIGEETGLAGTLTVLLLFCALALLGIRAARQAPDAFGFLLASAITGWISLQALINVGAVAGVLPITGVPLPLISFGGSSLLFSLAALGVLASIARRGAMIGPPKPRTGRRRDDQAEQQA